MKSDQDLREIAIIYIKGLLMGICDIIPGVSGGTMALISGIYERLVNAIGSIGLRPFMPLMMGDLKSFLAEMERIDIPFLAILAAGIITAIVLMSHIILYLLEYFPVETYSFFFGLIVASSAVLFLIIEHEDRGLKVALFLLAGAVAGFVVAGIPQSSLGHSPPELFVTGMIALCAMILPGISGAYITLLMNQYEYLLKAVKTLSFLDIFAYMVGGIIGLLVFSRLIKFLLRTCHAAMIALLTGLMLGSTRLLYDRILSSGSPGYNSLVFFILGICAIVMMECLKKRIVGARAQSDGN